MNPKNQAWQPLDPAGSLPGEIESALGDGDSLSACVVILVDSEIDRDWGAQASLAVARRWAASGRRVILADGCLDGPVLHEAAGVENGEGVSDMVLYGASAQRFTRRVEDRLMLAPAGTPVVEVADVLKHVRWDMMISGCREVGATLVCHVSTGTPGVEAMTERADGVLVLAPASKDVDAILGSTAGPLIAILGPGNGDAPPLASVDEEGDAVAVEALPGPPEEDEEVAVSVEAAAGPPEDEAPAALTVDDLPELPSSVVEDGETPDAFSVTAMEGAQDQEEAAPSDGSETADLEVGVDLGVVSPVDEGAEDAAEEDGETPDAFSVTAMEGAQDQEEAAPSDGSETADLEVGVDLGVVSPIDEGAEDSTESEEDVEGGAVAAGADTCLAADMSLGIEGFEAGAGVDLGGALDDLEDLTDQGSPEDPVSTGAVAGDGIDVGTLDLPGTDPVESEVGPAPGLGEPLAFSDAVSELVIDEPPEEVSVAEAEPTRRRKYRGLARLEQRRRHSVILRQFLIAALTILIVGGGGIAVAYYGLVNIPGITPPERVRSYVPAPVVLPGPIPRSGIMTHVLMIDSWRSMETPLATAEALRSRLPDLLFFIVPGWVEGTRQFALYVGPAYSAVEADALKGPVAAVMDRLDPDDWSVRDAPYAFYFGEYDTAVNAQGRIEALAQASIPAYSLQVDYADGTTGLRVYGGAFTDEFEAAQMGRIISDADIGGMVLTFRHGTLPE